MTQISLIRLKLRTSVQCLEERFFNEEVFCPRTAGNHLLTKRGASLNKKPPLRGRKNANKSREIDPQL